MGGKWAKSSCCWHLVLSTTHEICKILLVLNNGISFYRGVRFLKPVHKTRIVYSQKYPWKIQTTYKGQYPWVRLHNHEQKFLGTLKLERRWTRIKKVTEGKSICKCLGIQIILLLRLFKSLSSEDLEGGVWRREKVHMEAGAGIFKTFHFLNIPFHLILCLYNSKSYQYVSFSN